MQPWQPLLNWWFASDELAATARSFEVAAARQSLWFGKRDEQDAQARLLFGQSVEQALAGQLNWSDDAQGWLANLILLDQLPRMIFRNTAQAFAGDLQARALLTRGLEQGFDQRLPAIARVFAYLVYEHAEDLALQHKAVELFASLREHAQGEDLPLFENFLDYAKRHLVVIERFGRFPHRNEILGRPSTEAELAFLREPGSRF